MKALFHLLFCVVLFYGCQSSESASPPLTNRARPATIVQGFVATFETIEEQIEATGNLIANEQIYVRPEISGRLVELNLPEGKYMRKGTLLARIDDRDLLAQQNKLEVSLDLAEKEVERGAKLLKINGISQEEHDRLVNRVAELEADKKINAVSLTKTEIRAPFSGILGLRMISPGAYVTPSDILIDLQQINPIKIEFDVPEKFIKDVQIGQSLDYSISGYNEPFTASVFAISTDISLQTRTFKVRAQSPNPGGRLKPGQFAKVTLVTKVNDEAIMIPTDAIIPVLNGKQVFVANKGRAISRLVETGSRRSEYVQIISGIEPSDTIILSGLLGLTDGQAIQVENIDELQTP